MLFFLDPFLVLFFGYPDGTLNRLLKLRTNRKSIFNLLQAIKKHPDTRVIFFVSTKDSCDISTRIIISSNSEVLFFV